jgi:hypothetical protein
MVIQNGGPTRQKEIFTSPAARLSSNALQADLYVYTPPP